MTAVPTIWVIDAAALQGKWMTASYQAPCTRLPAATDGSRCTVDLWRPDDGCRLDSDFHLNFAAGSFRPVAVLHPAIVNDGRAASPAVRGQPSNGRSTPRCCRSPAHPLSPSPAACRGTADTAGDHGWLADDAAWPAPNIVRAQIERLLVLRPTGRCRPQAVLAFAHQSTCKQSFIPCQVKRLHT